MGITVGIIDIGLANVDSVSRAVHYLGFENKRCNSPDDFESVDKLIFPGVGNFAAATTILKTSQFDAAIKKHCIENKKPIMGICLGMQLLAEYGAEGGGSDGLGLIKGRVQLHRGAAKGITIPHIGWNDVYHQGGVLYQGIENGACFYFVHSYELILDCVVSHVAIANHGVDFVASFEYGHLFGVQFHPEKSQMMGLQMLNNFIEY